MKLASSLPLSVIILGTIFGSGLSTAFGNEGPYDPLAVPANWKSTAINLTVKDDSRTRDIPVRIYLPAKKTSAPVVLFSHGLGGTRQGNPYLGEHWSGRGYVVVFMQHIGSDESVWKDAPILQRMAAMKQAANLQNTLNRFKDVTSVIDQLERWNTSKESELNGRMDLSRVGMSGHSFGAVTTQGVSGQRTRTGSAQFTDARIKAAVIMSPNSPKNGGEPTKLFGGVSIPWMLMTGSRDIAAVGDADVESRLAVFPGLPAGNKYQLVLDEGEHEAFSDHALPGNKSKRNPNHHRVILALSTAFWDAYLQDVDLAKTWIDGSGPSQVLEKADRWNKK
ncbi:MAG: dienelactone hydrolase [Planctomycetota bacterium]|nr:dienelactone hydrolase [Planctomycetota bacterium]